MKIIRKLKYPVTILIFILILVYLLYTKKILNEEKYQNLNNDGDIIQTEIAIEAETSNIEQTCHIDIKGAVNEPGMYEVSCTLTVNDVIKLAKGLTDEADTSVINLAKKVNDEMVIIVYTKEEVKNSNLIDTVIKVVEQECVCPNIENDGCINNEINDTIGGDDLININTATLEQLITLPGIGESKAKSIINYRETNGKFKSIDELLEVEGIGNVLYEQIKVYLKT